MNRASYVAALLLCACGSTLKVSVQRYDTAAGAAAEAAYVKARSGDADAVNRLAAIRAAEDAIARYQKIDEAITTAAAGADVDVGRPESLQPIGVIGQALKDEKERLAGDEGGVPQTSGLAAAYLVAAQELDAMEQAATGKREPSHPDQALVKASRDALAAFSTNFSAALEQEPDGSVGGVTELKAAASALAKSPTEDEAKQFVEKARDLKLAEWRRVEGALAQTIGIGGWRVVNSNDIYSDPSDPFLTYIAATPELWRDIGFGAEVDGDGDAEYIIVFESPLDPRLKLVSVDPSRVIKARLHVARKAAQAAVAAGGIALSAYNIPLGQKIAKTGEPSTRKEADYSDMTAREDLLKARNDAFRQWLRQTARLARDRGAATDEATAARNLEWLRTQLLTMPRPTDDSMM